MDVILESQPHVTFATNVFRNVPVILQYEEFPLVEIGQFVPAGFTTRCTIYHPDGTKIAVVKGSQIYLTEQGEKASLKPRFEPNLTAIEL